MNEKILTLQEFIDRYVVFDADVAQIAKDLTEPNPLFEIEYPVLTGWQRAKMRARRAAERVRDAGAVLIGRKIAVDDDWYF